MQLIYKQHNNCNNLYHQLIHVFLPIYTLLEQMNVLDQRLDLCIVKNNSMVPILDINHFFNWDNIKYIKDHKLIDSTNPEKLVVLKNDREITYGKSWGWSLLHNNILNRFKLHICNKLNIDITNNSNNVLVIKRKQRVILNNDDLVHELKKTHNVKNIDLSQLTFKQQIEEIINCTHFIGL